jgi:hypothetical protein
LFVSDWGASFYGDPCHECGFEWGLSQDEAVSLVQEMPERYENALRGRNPSSRHPDLGWSAGAYVCHVGDNLRIWAERLVGFSSEGGGRVTRYDVDLLAQARAYESVPVHGALWSLRSAVEEWLAAVAIATRAGVILDHPDRGPQTVTDVVRTNAHDAFHHEWDIRRSFPDGRP